MKITWLGQAGLLFEDGETKILVDPYLTDSVAKIEPLNFRRQRIDERFLKIRPDVIVVTHDHADHMDKETLSSYLSENSRVAVLAPFSAWKEVRKFGGERNNYIMFNDGTTRTEKSVTFRAVKAEHSDEYAIGVVITADGKNYYVTGDTLYSERVFSGLPEIRFEAVFLPINGVGNNMNVADAEMFLERIKTKYAVPIHFGMFDCLTGEELSGDNVVIPKIYEEVELK